ncbi:hypothetical protein M2333_000220 [Sphingobium sp. B11D3B]|uniref:lasso peptide biosynthesis B2 protein n=1 Tax=Sphingobium sp. B11D3B TaxID=2940575 RepID=UPI002227B37E|nr:lasso peptide biosynthesis B2 protein [Sphingobium sp. B11D3B]MCW2387174.1 hypothetical protein [Sphingobium sp. B11D3B]
MRCVTAPGIFYCQAGPRLIFLDVNQDRYFQLSADLEAAFQAAIDGRLYSEQAVSTLIARGVLCSAETDTVSLPAQPLLPSRAADMLRAEASVMEAVKAVFAQIRAQKDLEREGLGWVIASLQWPEDRPAIALIHDPVPARIVRAFEHAKLVRTPANRCLSRSIALVRQLAAQGCRVHLVLGVRGIPFTAHAWVQTDDIVLNDSPEEVARFTPIFVL